MKIRVITMLAILTLLWAFYPAPQVSYSSPQETTFNQWLIESTRNDGKLQLTMRYRRERDTGFS